jgi:cytoskeletal protein CcmA (bactofilin family)
LQPGQTSNSKTEPNRTVHSAPESARQPESAKPAATKADYLEARKSAPSDDGSKLIVGPNIKLKGSEITDCEILVVEGRVEASMNSRDIRIAEGGVFSGKAEIDVAEVRGTFEGELTARKRLVVYATGKVSGTIRYGAMQVEEGGTISGDVATFSAVPGVARLADASTPAAPPERIEEPPEKTEPIRSGSIYLRNQAGRRQG